MSRGFDYVSFQQKLDNVHEWPSLYMFKFLVPKGNEHKIFSLFPKNELSTRHSSKGNYVSVTAKVMMGSSEDVIAIYKEAHKVEGILSL